MCKPLDRETHMDFFFCYGTSCKPGVRHGYPFFLWQTIKNKYFTYGGNFFIMETKQGVSDKSK